MKHDKPWYSIAMVALAIVTVSCSLAPQEAQAQRKYLIDGSNPQAIVEIASGYGSAELTTDNDGDPKITGRMEGIRYSIYFYGCSNGKNCDSIAFSTGWVSDRVSLQDINEWNKIKRFGRVYLDNEDDPMVEMNVNLDGGVSRENLDDTFGWWKIAITSFKEQFGL